MRFERLALWAGLGLPVCAQILVLTPDSLKSRFSATGGVINGGTAVFGAPYYGEHVLGRLRGLTSRLEHHCSDKDYELTQLQGTAITQGEQVHDILVIEDSERCSSGQKVRIAQGKKAKAVILVDQSGDSEKQVQAKIVGDDGLGFEVRIPSILVSKKTGETLFAAMRQESVLVELRWDIPQSEVVAADFWWSSGSRQSQEFLAAFRESAEVLEHRLQFTPHYYVFDVSTFKDIAMGGLCSKTRGSHGVKHCAPDPDGPGPITGSDVADEDVRQLCLWHKTAVAPNPATDGLYSGAWWNYVSRIYDYCPFKAETRANRFGSKTCSYKAMQALGIDTAVIDLCVQHHAGQYLEESAASGAWSEQALRINGWRYSGTLDAEIVLKAVCSGYATPLNSCEALLGGWMGKMMHLIAHRATKALSESAFGWLIGGICVLSVINCYLYRRHITKLVKRQMREEVMLEVQSQMADYAKLEGEGI